GPLRPLLPLPRPRPRRPQGGPSAGPEGAGPPCRESGDRPRPQRPERADRPHHERRPRRGDAPAEGESAAEPPTGGAAETLGRRRGLLGRALGVRADRGANATETP